MGQIGSLDSEIVIKSDLFIKLHEFLVQNDKLNNKWNMGYGMGIWAYGRMGVWALSTGSVRQAIDVELM